MSVSTTTRYAPIELLSGETKLNLFEKILKKLTDNLTPEERLQEKTLKAYARMKLKADRRNQKRKRRQRNWRPELHEAVLVKCQHTSDAAQGITGKFQRPLRHITSVK